MRIGIDIGSTTIKCAVFSDGGEMIYSAYERHFSLIQAKTVEIIGRIIRECRIREPVFLALSGSAGMGIAERCEIPFVQEVFAEKLAVTKFNPGTDCVIELGGEDAKILFLTNGTEVRMNGTCAGGTGAFIDQMCTLLNMDASQLNEAAEKAERIYTIASRCGVFAKSDIQPLINQGALTEDIALSIYQAVVNQTVAGLAQGRRIRGNVLYLGGPLTYASSLRRRFDETLKIKGTCPENSLLYVAAGAALYADQLSDLAEIEQRILLHGQTKSWRKLPPLFENSEEYWQFHNRHLKASVPLVRYSESTGPVHIGIDSGSTTVKIAVIDENCSLIYQWYHSNEGNPVPLVRQKLLEIYEKFPGIQIGSATVTGYGEEMIRQAFRCDFSIVETAAHFAAAAHFMPDVDFIIDIGGQDMKCFRISEGTVSDIFLNEACSSGCGSFLQTFASGLGFDVAEFAAAGLFSKAPVDLGSRCTVFMNSQVRQAQKDGASVEDISAGLSVSVVKNALYKVIRCSDPKELGKNIVVQGGTFYNEAVLRAFEKELGTEVVRPSIAGLMGAYGAALYGKRHSDGKLSSLLSRQELISFRQNVNSVTCGGCGNHCRLTVSTFPDGSRYISGNRCERPVNGKETGSALNLYAYKRGLLAAYGDAEPSERKETIGLPLCLNMYELLPFWHTLFRSLGFGVKVSPVSTHELYEAGSATIPSDTVCYPAKLAHGHITALCQAGADAVFYPCMSYNFDEKLGDNHYNCPVVAYYPEVLEDNCPELEHILFIRDFVSLSDRPEFTKRFVKILKKYWKDLSAARIRKAVAKAYEAYEAYMRSIAAEAQKIIEQARREKREIFVLAGRPYHADPEVSHGIDRLLVQLGAAVITEDSVSSEMGRAETSVLNQWTYHSRLYAAARWCTQYPDTNLIQLVSFGCGLDAITADEIKAILSKGSKLYTQIKIDEIANPGAVKIRLRSTLAAIEERREESTDE